ncbi:hypothetical protein OC846_003283 [Tilletia horrida]|uniref:Transcription factor Iwr1 domain-containing protein n=1 Tax=Tilletia horrida TaxID=155126 RepID=A0AAN6JS75_9BASI|nr:hypothetical protein OC845_006011 [Tilletia horrida]KAK0551505.1 hypothetical protein OC846_003283 [Tilletia horrida]KAK0566496.1 hypothetical protein OC861_003186 [Tilletia horrida]
MSVVPALQVATSAAAFNLRSEGERSKSSRRRHRTDEDDENEAPASQQQQASSSSGQDSHLNVRSVDPSSSAAHQQLQQGESAAQTEAGPARKRRRKSRPHLLGGSIAPGPWSVSDLDNSTTSSSPNSSVHLKRSAEGRSRERGDSSSPAKRIPPAGRSVLGDGFNTGGAQDAAPKASGSLTTTTSKGSEVDAADAMAVDDIDQKFADMLQEFLRLEAPMKSQHVDFSQLVEPPRRSSSKGKAPARTPKERIIPGMGPRPSDKKPGSSTGLGADGALLDSANSSDWEDEEEGDHGRSKKRQEETADDSSDPDYDREGEDEDSNSEGFYRNDYPEGEGNDDDAGMFFNSEEEEDEDEEAEASDQYGDELDYGAGGDGDDFE